MFGGYRYENQYLLPRRYRFILDTYLSSCAYYVYAGSLRSLTGGLLPNNREFL